LPPVDSALGILASALLASARLASSAHRHTLTLARAITDRVPLTAHLAEMFAADTVRVEVLDIDLVRDTTLVDVRYKTLPRRRANAAADAQPGSRTSADHAAGILDTEVR